MTGKKYILRTMDKDGRSHGGFQWNLEIGGETVAPDWSPRAECGNGLHGFLNGQGDGSLANWESDAIWAVVSTTGEVVDLGGKVKFERGTTEFVGDLAGAAKFLSDLGINNAVIGGTATAGYKGTATAGYRGTATAGDEGTATAGYRGTATAGNGGTATAGNGGTATAGDYGTATAGNGGALIIEYSDGIRPRVLVGYVGEDGIKPNVAYKISDGKFVEAD